MSRQKAFTYLELMIVAVVVAILVVSAMPDSDTAAQLEAVEAARIFQADVDYARSASIARPDDPVIIKLDSANDTYWLARESTPDVPIAHPLTGRPYKIAFGSATDARFTSVHIQASDFDGDQILGFDSVGSTDQDSDAVLQLRSGSAEMEIRVSPAKAGTKIVENYTVALIPVETVPDGEGETPEGEEGEAPKGGGGSDGGKGGGDEEDDNTETVRVKQQG